MISNREVKRVTLPCTSRIDVRISSNWIFDLNTPKPDHMEQDVPYTGTHAYTIPAFPDSYACTSSRYHPHKKYDYTTMRTTLDDVLSEIRHWNDAGIDRDVLLRNIQRQ